MHEHLEPQPLALLQPYLTSSEQASAAIGKHCAPHANPGVLIIKCPSLTFWRRCIQAAVMCTIYQLDALPALYVAAKNIELGESKSLNCQRL